MTRKVLAFSAIAAGFALPASALATSGSVRFTSGKTGSATGVQVSASTLDSSGEPKGLRGVAITFPRGTVFDPLAAGTCQQPIDVITQQGAAACPKSSLLGSGSAEAISGLGPPIDPVHEAGVAIDGGTGIYLRFEGTGTAGALLALWAGFSGPLTLNVDVPLVCLPGGEQPTCGTAGHATVSGFGVKIRAVKRGGRALVRTPKSCPAGGWPLSLTLTYEDATKQTFSKRSPCRKG
jgi:hypothetical protein